MRLYEIVYIFDASLDEAAVTERIDGYHGLLTEAAGAEVTAVAHWGTRQLAYPVNKKKMGYYVVAHVLADPAALPEFERRLKLDDDVMRYLVVLNEGEPISGMSIAGPDRSRPDEDDDEEDEDEDEGPEDDQDVEVTRSGAPPEFGGGRGRRRRIEGPSIELLNYKDVNTLARFMTEQGKILPKRTTKVSARFQRQLGRAIKRARYLALVPYVRDHEA